MAPKPHTAGGFSDWWEAQPCQINYFKVQLKWKVFSAFNSGKEMEASEWVILMGTKKKKKKSKWTNVAMMFLAAQDWETTLESW